MKTRARMFLAVAIFAAIGFATLAQAQPQEEKKRNAVKNDQASQDEYVLITGSNIPQRVKKKAIGTNTSSPMRIIDRREIEQTGQSNTVEVLRYDPSVTVIGR